MPEPLGESVTTTTTMDANLNHCLATGKSLTGCLHFVNKTPVDWYSKKQATVETATYGSEFVAAKTATEQIMDIRQTVRYLGAPITTKSFLFGDNRSVVTSATLPHSTLTKRHNILAFHRVSKTYGKFDIHAQVATMSRFRAAPRQGHMDRLKRIYSYAIRTKDYAIRFRTENPDYSFLPDQDFDWTYSVYGDVHKILPDDMPEPLGESVTTTTTINANLNHCLATGKSLTGCLHFVNKTPVDWYSKKQATVETATYGSEFVAAKTATEQIMDIRQTLRYLGAPITTKSFLFGDNRSVVTSATLPHSTLTKRHSILAFHRVREAIAAKLMAFYCIQSAYNLSDMLSKHWDHPSVYPMILKLLITRGNITLIPREATQEKEKEILNPQKEKLKIEEKQN